MSTPDDQIRALAYHLWQQDGCPDGQDLDYWLRAESLIHTQAESAANDPVPNDPLPVPDNQPPSPVAKPRSKSRASSPPKAKAPRKSKKSD